MVIRRISMIIFAWQYLEEGPTEWRARISKNVA